MIRPILTSWNTYSCIKKRFVDAENFAIIQKLTLTSLTVEHSAGEALFTKCQIDELYVGKESREHPSLITVVLID